jgi:hypothetical protein
LGAFGEKLRKQREQRGLALDAISNSTKISTRMLRALEDEHFDQLPGGVFNKGFVRAYARQVGLDEEEAITDYLAALRESQVQSQKILPDFRIPGDKPRPTVPHDSRHHVLPSSDHPGGDGKDVRDNGERRRNEERRNGVRRNQDRDHRDQEPTFVVAPRKTEPKDHREDEREKVNSKLDPSRPDLQPIAQSVDHRNEDHRKEDHRSVDHPSPSSSSSSMTGFITLGPAAGDSIERTEPASPGLSRRRKLAAALLLLTVGLVVWLSHRSQGSAPNSVSSSNPSSSTAAAQAPAAAVMAPVAAAPKNASPSSGAKPPLEKSTTPPASPKVSPAASIPSPPSKSSPGDSLAAETTTLTAKASPTFTLRIRADQTTWISITADGKAIGHETLIAPAHTSVRATRDIAVKVGNAAGVSFLLNGKEFPAEGNVGEVKTYVFDASGLKSGPEPPPSTANQ